MAIRAVHTPAWLTLFMAGWLVLAPSAAAQGESAPNPASDGIVTITVVPFTSSNLGQDIWLGKAVADLLSRKLAEVPPYAVLNRDRLRTFLEEMELKASGFFEQADASRLGHIAKVDQVIYGNFDRRNEALTVRLLLVDLETQTGVKRAEASGSLAALPDLVADLALQVLSLEGVSASADTDAKIRFTPTSSLPAIEYFYTAFDHLDNGRIEDAFGAFSAAARRDPQFREAELWMGRALEAAGFDDLAVAAYDKLAARPGRHVEILDARFFKALLLESANPDAAIIIYRQLAELRPETPHTLEAAFRLAALLEARGDIAGAYDRLLMIDTFRAEVERRKGETRPRSIPAAALKTLVVEARKYLGADAAGRARQRSLPYYVTQSGVRRSRFFSWPHALGLYREAILHAARLLPALPDNPDAPRSPPRGVFLVDPANPEIAVNNHAALPSLFHEETLTDSWREKFFAVAIPAGYVATGVDMEVAGRANKRSPSISYSMRLLPFPWPANYHNAWLGTIYGQTSRTTRLRKSVNFHGQSRRALALQFIENTSDIEAWRLKVRLRAEADLAPPSEPPLSPSDVDQEGTLVARIAKPTGTAAGPALPLFKYLRHPRANLSLANRFGRGFDLVFVRGELGGNPTDLWGTTSSDSRTWTAPRRLPINSASEDYAPRLVRTERGDLRLFWLSDRRGAGWEVWTSVKAGPEERWQAPSRVARRPSGDNRPALAARGPAGLPDYAVIQDHLGRWLVASVEAHQSEIALTTSADGMNWKSAGAITAPAQIRAVVLAQDRSDRYLLGGTTSDGRFRLWRSNDLRDWQMLRLDGARHFGARIGPAGYPSNLFVEADGKLLLVISDAQFGLRYARFDPDRGIVRFDLIKDAGLEAYALAAARKGSYLLALEQPDGIDVRRYSRFQSPLNGPNPTGSPIYTEVEVDRSGNRWHRTFARARFIAPDVTAIASEADGRIWWGIETGVMSVKGRDFFFRDASMGFFTHNVTDIEPCGDAVYFAALHDDQERLAMARIRGSRDGRTDYAVEVIDMSVTAGAVTALACQSIDSAQEHQIVVGTKAGDVASFAKHNLRWRLRLPDSATVTALAVDATDGAIYAATAAGGLYRIERGQAQSLAPPTGAGPISALTLDRNGRLWIARQGSGLFRRDPAGWAAVAPDRFPYRSIAALAADTRRGVWVLPGPDITSRGVARVTATGFEFFNPPSRRLAQPIDFDVAANGDLWIGTALNGFYRLERSRP